MREFDDVVYVKSWADPRVTDIAGDCMVRVADGVHFHARRRLLIVVTGCLPAGVAACLPCA